MKLSFLKKYILEKVSIKNTVYQQMFNNFLIILDRFQGKTTINIENYSIIMEDFLKLPLFCNCFLWNQWMDSCKKVVDTTDLYIQSLPNCPFRTKYNNIFNKYKNSDQFKLLIQQWIQLNKKFDKHQWQKWIQNINIYNEQFFETTKTFLQLKFLTSSGKFNICQYIFNNNYSIL